MLGENLLRFNKNRRYISLDSETEGLNLFYSRPQQLSWIIYENGKVIQENNRYLWWEDFNISKEAAAITRFN